MFLDFISMPLQFWARKGVEQKELEVHKGRPEIKHNWMSVEVGGR